MLSDILMDVSAPRDTSRNIDLSVGNFFCEPEALRVGKRTAEFNAG